VILGRGANFITPFGKGLHVNITAPYFIRVRRAMDYEGLSEQQAKEVLQSERTKILFNNTLVILNGEMSLIYQ
jgi:hypothetical protein